MSGLQDIFEDDESGLLEAPVKVAPVTATDRLERSFLEIIDFRRAHGRAPSPTTRQIAERKLGARLDGVLADPEKIDALRHLDEFGLLEPPEPPVSLDELLDSGDELLGDASGLLDTSTLPARAHRTDPEDVAQRVRSTDFERFEPLFRQKHAELAEGTAELVPYRGISRIVEGAFFVLSGVMAFVAEVGADEQAASGSRKQRLRCVFENGTESSMYRQSLGTRLYEDGGFAVVPAQRTEVFPDDTATGSIYVLRSKSDDPQVAAAKDLVKIGFTRGSVEQRIANAAREPTYLMAPVEVIATYRTYNLKASALEHLLHRVFADVRLQIAQTGRDGRRYEPDEWFVVPLAVIDRAVELIQTGDIVDWVYDAKMKQLRPAAA